MEQAVASLVEAGLAPETAFDVHAAVSLHVRGSVVLQRLRDRATVRPHHSLRGHQGMARKSARWDEVNFNFGLECLLDHAERLIAADTQPARARKTPPA